MQKLFQILLYVLFDYYFAYWYNILESKSLDNTDICLSLLPSLVSSVPRDQWLQTLGEYYWSMFQYCQTKQEAVDYRSSVSCLVKCPLLACLLAYSLSGFFLCFVLIFVIIAGMFDAVTREYLPTSLPTGSRHAQGTQNSSVHSTLPDTHPEYTCYWWHPPAKYLLSPSFFPNHFFSYLIPLTETDHGEWGDRRSSSLKAPGNTCWVNYIYPCGILSCRNASKAVECLPIPQILTLTSGKIVSSPDHGNHCDFQQISMILPTFWTLP